ncbi:MAG TPA: putative metalloprotease CJM1_0395 family protein [Burkholderiaceae bacterium]|nr:putative metalloprotease CJM1_0395 family protein [Burkholderiaceae bacterium]
METTDAADPETDTTEKSEETERAAPGELSPAAQQQVGALRKRDRAVRQHEQAHLAASGGLAISGAAYTFQRGPDGVNYAIGGEVSIDISPGRTPEETIRRARIIQAAALAPADPSSTDRAIAAYAAQMAQNAQIELARQARDASQPNPAQAQDRINVYA